VLAAVPLMRGADVASAWHAAKIAECGGLCTVNPTSPGVMMSIGRDGFTIEPLSPANPRDKRGTRLRGDHALTKR
jgi:hypothetical protein